MPPQERETKQQSPCLPAAPQERETPCTQQPLICIHSVHLLQLARLAVNSRQQEPGRLPHVIAVHRETAPVPRVSHRHPNPLHQGRQHDEGPAETHTSEPGTPASQEQVERRGEQAVRVCACAYMCENINTHREKGARITKEWESKPAQQFSDRSKSICLILYPGQEYLESEIYEPRSSMGLCEVSAPDWQALLPSFT